MRIIRAQSLGMCFGVRDAISLAVEHAGAGPLTILGDLVHNTTVLNGLRDKGIAIVHDVGEVRTPTVLVTAHGASERALANTRARGLEVVEATCPLVHVAHRAVHALVRDGYHPVIIGQRAHVEVRGLTDDLEEFDIVLDDEDVAVLDEHPRIGVAAQTTQSIERVRHLVALIRAAVPAIRRPLHRHRLPPDQGSPESRPRPGAPIRRRASSSAARTATTRASWPLPAGSSVRSVHHVQTASDLRVRVVSGRWRRGHHGWNVDA